MFANAQQNPDKSLEGHATGNGGDIFVSDFFLRIGEVKKILTWAAKEGRIQSSELSPSFVEQLEKKAHVFSSSSVTLRHTGEEIAAGHDEITNDIFINKKMWFLLDVSIRRKIALHELFWLDGNKDKDFLLSNQFDQIQLFYLPELESSFSLDPEMFLTQIPGGIKLIPLVSVPLPPGGIVYIQNGKFLNKSQLDIDEPFCRLNFDQIEGDSVLEQGTSLRIWDANELFSAMQYGEEQPEGKRSISTTVNLLGENQTKRLLNSLTCTKVRILDTDIVGEIFRALAYKVQDLQKTIQGIFLLIPAREPSTRPSLVDLPIGTTLQINNAVNTKKQETYYQGGQQISLLQLKKHFPFCKITFRPKKNKYTPTAVVEKNEVFLTKEKNEIDVISRRGFLKMVLTFNEASLIDQISCEKEVYLWRNMYLIKHTKTDAKNILETQLFSLNLFQQTVGNDLTFIER